MTRSLAVSESPSTVDSGVARLPAGLCSKPGSSLICMSSSLMKTNGS
jgi:hypothetical protein